MTAATIYVSTPDMKAAVTGRETEILTSLGIDWRKGRPHIRCPYPQHEDRNPSWRWDEQRARAHCSCANGDTIFNVVMKIEGIDFNAAKLRIAELLGRPDLIRERSAGPRSQATDAESLLNPPLQDRDDRLGANYLAHRLRVSPHAVPMPATPVVGIKVLGYYDAPPPAQGRGRPPKPVHVGDFPCVVFGAVDAGGNRHAHRIYVAPDGAGKAGLGARPDGYPRDPKKSAKVTDGQNTAGRSVLWGNPEQAASILVCEGIETGAALAYAFRTELDAGKLALAAAISATGMEAFKPWAATKNLIVCADRDEAPKPSGKPGSRRGALAARRLALRLNKDQQVFIAIPGANGESADWLDIHNLSGGDAVRNGVQAAERFVPTDAERSEDTIKVERHSELQEIATAYPLPQLDTLKLTYQRTLQGTVKVHKSLGVDIDPVTGISSEQWIPIATPFGITARLRYANQTNAYGLRVSVQDMAGRSREVDFDRAGLAKMAGAEIKSMLFAAGLRTRGRWRSRRHSVPEGSRSWCRNHHCPSAGLALSGGLGRARIRRSGRLSDRRLQYSGDRARKKRPNAIRCRAWRYSRRVEAGCSRGHHRRWRTALDAGGDCRICRTGPISDRPRHLRDQPFRNLVGGEKYRAAAGSVGLVDARYPQAWPLPVGTCHRQCHRGPCLTGNRDRAVA